MGLLGAYGASIVGCFAARHSIQTRSELLPDQFSQDRTFSQSPDRRGSHGFEYSIAPLESVGVWWVEIFVRSYRTAKAMNEEKSFCRYAVVMDAI